MKKTLLICLIAAAAIVGCKKEDSALENDTKNVATTNKLLGSWSCLTETETHYETGKAARTDSVYKYAANELVIEFGATQFKLYEYGKMIEEPYTYSVSGDKINYIEDTKPKVLTIKSQTDKNLTLSSESSNVSNGITYRDVVERTFVKK